MPHIDHNKKFIFVHVPKCAGNTIKKLLNLSGHDHGSISNVSADLSNYFKFAFVRNPWDRFVSAYEFLKQGGYPGGFDVYQSSIVNKFNNIKEFAKEIKPWTNWIHFKPQFEYILKDNNINYLDFIGNVEHLNTDLKVICKNLDIPLETIPLVNKVERKHYTEYYDDELKDIITAAYSEDIKYFNYEYE